VTQTEDTTGTTGCPVITLDITAGGKEPGEWVRIYDQLRAQNRMLFSDFGPAGGFFITTRHDDMLQVLQDPETWSSRTMMVLDPNPQTLWIPEMLDPPEHTTWRQQLGPLFSPKQVDRLEDAVRSRVVELIDGFEDAGACDFAADFANKFPTSVFLEMMGLPVEELDTFMAWEADILHGDNATPEGLGRMQAAMGEVMGYFAGLVEKRRADPQDDIISKALAFDIDGRPPTQDELLAFLLLMFMAGLDTVTQNLNYSIYHLASHPEDRARLVSEPALIPSAIEEFVRAYSIVIGGRKATRDTEIGGCPIKAGQMILVPLSSACRDEAEFPDSTTVKIDRTPNNHIGFGAGPHRCLGSHLARREMKIALEEWHKRIPDYRLADGAAPKEHGGMLGLDSVPLVWDVR